MRLKTVSSDLAQYFFEEQKTGKIDLQVLFEQTFWTCFDALDESMRSELVRMSGMDGLMEHRIPTGEHLESIRDDLDTQYMAAEDAGNRELSERKFRLARMVAAMVLNEYAQVGVEWSEAAYEALMSTQDPHKYAGQSLKAYKGA